MPLALQPIPFVYPVPREKGFWGLSGVRLIVRFFVPALSSVKPPFTQASCQRGIPYLSSHDDHEFLQCSFSTCPFAMKRFGINASWVSIPGSYRTNLLSLLTQPFPAHEFPTTPKAR